MSTGKLEAIWLKRAKRGPMDPKTSANLKAGRGLVGNANQGGKRQVTILAQERWQALMAQTGANLNPAARRANLMVSDIELANSRGQGLQIGPVQIRIYNETRPCERMDEAHFGLREAMKTDWGGGAFGEVLNDGEIRVGDLVQWVTESAEHQPQTGHQVSA